MSKRTGPVKSSGYGRPASSKPDAKQQGAAAAEAAPVHEPTLRMEKNEFYELPAISILMKKKADMGEEWREKRKKKMVRRNVPPGEDTQKLKDIVKSLKDQEINVHEFVGLIAPSSGDEGLIMRNILAEEMTSFRKMCRRVYDTMSQDVSDVLANEQVQLTDNCNARIAVYSDKMMRSIDEIFAFIPDFDFEKYYQDEDYLKKKFPLCIAMEGGSADDEEALLRQEAFHRYQWLRSEGDRLSAENTRLQERLNALKRQQKEEMQRAQQIQTQTEDTREQLEATEEALQEKVEELNKSIEQTMVEHEVSMMKNIKKTSKRGDELRELKKKRKKKLEEQPDWNVGAAQAVEEIATEQATQGQISQVSFSESVALSESTGAVRKQLKQPKAGKKRPKFQRPKLPPQDADAFHYSPPKTPPGQQTSPFHYSPNRGGQHSPETGMGMLPGHQATPSGRRVRMESSTTVMEPTQIPKGPRYSHHHSTNLW